MRHRTHGIWDVTFQEDSDDEQEAVNEHPAATPSPTSDKCLFLVLPPELCNDVYDDIAEDVNVVARSRKGSIFCRHPLAGPCKQIRQEFLGRVERERVTKATKLIAQVENFEFGALIKTLERNQYLTATPAVLRVKVYHIITNTDFNVERLISWAKFAAAHSTLDRWYTVGDMPPPNTRQPFVRRLLWLARDLAGDMSEINRIIGSFTHWWGHGSGEFDWLSEDDLRLKPAHTKDFYGDGQGHQQDDWDDWDGENESWDLEDEEADDDDEEEED